MQKRLGSSSSIITIYHNRVTPIITNLEVYINFISIYSKTQPSAA